MPAQQTFVPWTNEMDGTLDAAETWLWCLHMTVSLIDSLSTNDLRQLILDHMLPLLWTLNYLFPPKTEFIHISPSVLHTVQSSAK